MQKIGQWQVHVVNAMHNAFTEIYIYKNYENRREIITNLSTMEVKSFDRGASTVDVEPTIKVDWACGQEVLQALVDGLYEHGIKAEKEPVLKDELTATKYHLEDMRKIMFEHVGNLVKKAVGNSLRNHYAGLAMQALMTTTENLGAVCPSDAFDMADAMMEQVKKPTN